ncbi:MAG TPA: MraY family glycosyltransferase [Candidatus Saccharimonadales bacterium]|nr:MraY family glycosyltransferase [Candidatus Saccharimonadales bacterium]
MPIDITVLPLIAAFLGTVLATPLSLIFIKKFNIVDDPKTHKHPAMIHKNPIPRGGGIPLFIGVLVSSLFFIPINKTTISLIIASFITMITGTIDDKYDLSPYLRFSINLLCAVIVVGGGISIPFITNPLGGILHLDTIRFSFDFLGQHSILVFSDILAVLWIMWVMNMLNWSKGVDGQMPGVVAISAIVIGLLSLRFSLYDPFTLLSIKFSFIIAGAALGFLLYNFYPARIFPGYGATCIYLLLAAVSIMSSVKLATAILVMGVPMVDGLFTIGRRILSGRSPFWGDKKHLHHLLLGRGFGQRRIALSYWLFSALLGVSALLLSSTGKLLALVMLVIILGGGLLFLHTNRKKLHET